MSDELFCPNCGKFGIMVLNGNVQCVTNYFKSNCGWNQPIGTTPESVKEEEEKAKIEAEKAKKEAEEAAKIMEKKLGKDPLFRIGEYLESSMRNEFERDGDYHIYLIELEEPRFRTSCTFPNLEFPLHTDFDSSKGYVWIGISNIEVEEDFRRLVRENSSALGIRVMLEHKISPNFDTCGKPLTEKFGFTGIETIENTYFLQVWLGWALYKAGYWVWLGSNPQLPALKQFKRAAAHQTFQEFTDTITAWKKANKGWDDTESPNFEEDLISLNNVLAKGKDESRQKRIMTAIRFFFRDVSNSPFRSVGNNSLNHKTLRTLAMDNIGSRPFL